MRLSPAERLREEVIDRARDGDLASAAELYRELLQHDPQHVLPRQVQLDLANFLAQQQRHAEAAHAYEAYLSAYPGGDVGQVRLLLGLIYARYLGRWHAAADHLRKAAGGLAHSAQRELAEQELRQVEARLAESEGDST